MDLGPSLVSGSGNAATATSAAFTPTDAGHYCFAADFTGDNHYSPTSTPSTDGACFTVSSATLSPVGLGSPENSFGTGDLSLGAGSPTNIWAAVNGFCTSKENGDEFLSRFDATFDGQTQTYNCSATQTSDTPFATGNDEYDPSGYIYDIETPDQTPGTTLTSALTVAAYDPGYNPDGCAAGGLSPDNAIGGSGTSITTVFSLYYAPDPTDTPSPSNLLSTYAAGTNDPASCGQWVTLGTIPAGSADGTYQLQVSTPQQPGQLSDGSNAYGLEVYQGPTFIRCSTIVSVAWFSPDCPTIEGQSALSVYANTPSSTGTFYLADVDASHDNGTMEINLFDPGEGDHYIQILDPNGNPVPFTYQTTDQCPLPDPDQGSTDCAGPGGIPFEQTEYSGSSETGAGGLADVLDVSENIGQPPGIASQSQFNDRHVQLSVNVPTSSTGWWQIRYYSNGDVTDRTTWSVSMSGTASESTTSRPLRRATKSRHRPRGARPAT